MAILKILTFPDARLREVSKVVEKFDSELKTLSENMIETMYDAKGIGLAAPQVAELKRMVVIDTRPRDKEGRRYQYDEMTELEKAIQQPLILINPKVTRGEGKTTFDEGCLSVPTYFETVERFNEIEVTTQTLDGKKMTFKVDGLLAICIQHELDHLEGTLFIDHISFIKSQRIKTQIKKHGYSVKEDDEDETEDEKPRQKSKTKSEKLQV